MLVGLGWVGAQMPDEWMHAKGQGAGEGRGGESL